MPPPHHCHQPALPACQPVAVLPGLPLSVAGHRAATVNAPAGCGGLPGDLRIPPGKDQLIPTLLQGHARQGQVPQGQEQP